jgi:hypothetical protein
MVPQPSPHRGEVGADDALEQPDRHRDAARGAAHHVPVGHAALVNRLDIAGKFQLLPDEA